MGKAGKERAVVPCDCSTEQLVADYRQAKSDFPEQPLYWGFIPWSPTFGYLLCKQHRVYRGITLGAKNG